MGEIRNAHKILVEYLNGRNHSKDIGTDVRIILKWI
jgi:hypothetical protein